MRCFDLLALNSQRLNLSNEVPPDDAPQGAAKMQAVKVQNYIGIPMQKTEFSRVSHLNGGVLPRSKNAWKSQGHVNNFRNSHNSEIGPFHFM